MPSTPSCETVRQRLLDHVYGALDDAEAAEVESHVAVCAACRAALDVARGQSVVLAKAARAEAGDVTFARPQSQRQSKPLLITRPWRVGIAAALVAGVALGAVDALVTRSEAVSEHPILVVDGPSSVARGVPAEYRVRLHDVDGAPVAGRVLAGFDGQRGAEAALGEVTVGDDGNATLALDTSKFAPGAGSRIAIWAVFPDRSESVATRFNVREATRLVTRVSTDKPLYRPGDVLRVRGVALESLRLTPAGDTDLRLRLLDPKGATVSDVALPTLSGVTAWEHALPADAVGGTWKLVLAGKDGAAIAASEQTFRVRSYRVPRLRFDTELDRTSYRPGDRGTAWIEVKRAEGGVPAGATAEATLFIDGENVASRETYPVGAGGSVSVPFTLPTAIEEGRATLTVTVRDGGAVETTSKTIPLVTETVKFEAFPEGGRLVGGLPNRVYFRAKTPAGEPADLDAELRDSRGTRVAAVRSEVKGLGVFELTPAAGETYHVVFASSGSPVGEGATLSAEATGTTLRTLDDEVGARSAVRARVGSTTGGRFTVAAWCRGVALGEEIVDVPRGATADASIHLRSEVGGVLRLTVTDAANVPVAERLVARRPARHLDVAVTPSRTKSAPRERMSVAVRVRDESGVAAQTILGASVVDASMLSLADDRDTASLAFHFLVGMEVNELEDAEVFAGGPDSARAVDRLLGVQGWRRFAWRNPAGFASAHPDAGPRIAPVGAADVPNHASNERRARRDVTSSVASSVRHSAGLAITFGVIGLFLGAIVVGARAVKLGRSVVAGAAFTVPFVLFVAVVALSVTRYQSSARRTWSEPGSSAEQRALDEAAELTFSKDSTGTFGDAILDRLLGHGDDAVPKTAAAPSPFARAPGAKSEVLSDREQADEDAELADGRERLADLERMMALGYIGGARSEGARSSAEELNDWTASDDDEGGRVAEFKKARAARLVREYAYSHKAAAGGDARSDFAEVLAWVPLLVTDAQGEAKFEFDTSDSITGFRIAVDGHDGRGALGSGAAEFSNRVPFFAEPKFPVALTAGDEVDLPVVVANDSDRPLDVSVHVGTDGKLLALRGAGATATIAGGDAGSAPTAMLTVPADARARTLVPLVALSGRGASSLDVDATAGTRLRDRSRRSIDVLPRGFPITVNRSGVLEKEDATTIVLPDALQRVTLRGSLRIYPSTLATLVDGLDAMLAEPHGCFEQVSSSNYPNVLVLQYLEQQGGAAPAVARRAKDLLAKGYAMLTGYECPNRGYEWFGKEPAHEGLTAYGVLEFADMASVFPVDAAMAARTRDWLLGRRDGSGGFRRLAGAHDGFAHAPQTVHDAYTAWALSEADTTTDLSAELARIAESVATTSDPYLLALAANTLRNRSHAAAVSAVRRLASVQRQDGGFDAKGTSITSSNGVNLEVETTGLAVVAFAKSPEHAANGEAAVRFLLSHRRGGSFGATQATVLALRALTAHARVAGRNSTDHDVTVLVDDVPVARRSIAAGAPGVVEIDAELLDALTPGEHRIALRTTGAEALPWALALDYTTNLPAGDSACPVGIDVRLAAGDVREGDPVEATVVVRNRADVPQAMTLARVGVPAGLEPRVERLDTLVKSGAIDFYELRPLEIVLYWRGLAPSAEKRIAIELTATIPGRFEGPASSAYLYYGDDVKSWSAPLRCAVGAAERR